MTDMRQTAAWGVISFRNKPHLTEMIERLKKKTNRRQSDIIRECLATHLPKMCKENDADD